MYADQARRTTEDNTEELPRVFGKKTGADHIAMYGDKDIGLHGERAGLVMRCHGTKFLGFAATMTKDALESRMSIADWKGKDEIEEMYTDRSPELKQAIDELNIPHPRSKPYVPTNNAWIERTVRLIVESARALLLAAGFGVYWWPCACAYFEMAYNISMHWFSSLARMESPWFLRFGQQFPGLRPIFGQLVWFRPMQPTVDKLAKFDPRGQWGVFIGWDFQRGRRWDKVYKVVAVSSFKKGAPKNVNFAH